jgi:hypothetical protein
MPLRPGSISGKPSEALSSYLYRFRSHFGIISARPTGATRHHQPFYNRTGDEHSLDELKRIISHHKASRSAGVDGAGGTSPAAFRPAGVAKRRSFASLMYPDSRKLLRPALKWPPLGLRPATKPICGRRSG